MAIRGGDGSIILTTSVDTSGISKGSNTIKTMLNNIGNSAKQTGVKLQSAFVSLKDQRATFQVLTQAIKDQQYAINALSQEYAELVAKGKGNSQQAQKLRDRIKELTAEMKDLEYAANSVGNKGTSAFNKLGQSLMKLASYLIGIQTVFKFINFSKEAGQAATQQEANVQRLIDIYGEASQAVGDYIDANARALGMSRSAAAQFSAVYGNLFSVWADQKTNAELTAQYLNMTAVVASKSGRTVEDVQERVRSGLLGNTEAIEDLGVFVNVKTIEMTDAFKRMADGRSWEQLGAYEQQQIRTMAILEQATQKYGTTVANTTALTRAQYKAAYEDMQATWGQFVNVVLMPVLKVVTQIMNIITAGMRAIAGITGKTIETSQIQSATANDTANAIGNAVDNQEALTDATKKTAKEQKKLLAEFDDVQILSQNVAESGGAGAGTGAVGGGVADLGLTGGGTGGQEEGISTMLATIMGVVGGAMVALGVLLIWNGHIGWGIGFIIAGASALGVSAAAVGNADIDFSQQFSSIMAMVGGSLLALGLVLFFKTKSPIAHKIGLGMIIAGAGVLAVSAVQIAANQIGGDIGDMLHGIIAIASGFLLAIGLIMLFSGKITPLSIGLTITGAVGLASEVALYPDAVIESLRGWLGAILALLSTALLVIGIIMCATSHITPVSIGLIIAGAVGLASVAAVNWNFIVQQMQGTFGKIMAIVSAGLIVIGLLIIFASGGTALGLGLGLIIAGAAGLATVVAFNWNFIVDKVKEVWQNIKNYWNENIAPIFTAEWWKNLGKTVMNGLIAGFEAGINGIIGMFEKMINWIVDGLNKIKFDIPDWVPGIGGKTFGFNISKVKFNRVDIPPLAKGTVVPPNRKFLAMLGDNTKEHEIVSPVSTMKQAFTEAMIEMGGNFGGGNTEVVLEIDGREFGRAVVEQGNIENRRIGTRLVSV